MNWTPWHQIGGIAQIEGRPPNPEALALLHAHLPPNLVLVPLVIGVATLTLSWRQMSTGTKTCKCQNCKNYFWLLFLFGLAQERERELAKNERQKKKKKKKKKKKIFKKGKKKKKKKKGWIKK